MNIFRGLRGVAASLAIVTVPAAALAAPPALQVAPDHGAAGPAAVDPQKLALADRYLTDTHFDRDMPRLAEESFRRAMEASYRTMEADVPVVPQSIKDEMYRSQIESIRAMLPKVRSRVARVYASEYTTEELQALVDFYESPVGRSITAKQLDISAATRRAVNELVPEMGKELARRFCAREAQCPQRVQGGAPGSP
jgi:hypothetical protein